MKKVLFAIDNQRAERKLSELIRDAKTQEEYQVVGTPVSNESVTDFLRNKTADILVYMEGLGGDEDSFDYVLKLHKKYPNIRIVFIAGQRSVGDKMLAMLVAFHIYDIISGQKILMPDVAKRILNPATFEDVSHYLPEVGGDLFRDIDFRIANSTTQIAQRDSERLAERAYAHRQMTDLKAINTDLSLKLDAAEARLRRLEEEKTNWDTAAGKERMLLERKFDEDRKVLCAKIKELETALKKSSEQIGAAEQQIGSSRAESERLKSELEKTQRQNSATAKTLHMEIEKLKKEKDNLNGQLESYRKKLKPGEDLIANAKAQADKIIADAANVLAEAETHRALFVDQTFEEYKDSEIKKIEAMKKEAAVQIERDMQQATKDQRAEIDRLEGVILAKQEEIANAEQKLQRDLEASKQKKSEELNNIDAEYLKRKHELEILDKSIIQKNAELGATQRTVDIVRKENEAKLQAAAEEFEQKYAAVLAEYERASQDAEKRARSKTEAELSALSDAVAAEKNRLAGELNQYKQEIEEEKKRLLAKEPGSYRYNEKDFIINGARAPKSKILMFHSPTPGSGNSTVAINAATYLAMKGNRTIYIELNWQNPTLKDNLGIAMMRNSVNDAIMGVCEREFTKIDNQIITKQQILSLKTAAKGMQAKFPDMLCFMSYTRGEQLYCTPTAEILKGLIAYLKYRKNFAYVVIDLPSYASEELMRECYTISDRHVLTTCQDIASMQTMINLQNIAEEISANYGTSAITYVINKYVDGTVLGSKKISDVCGLQNVVILPQDMDDMLLASYKSIPAILISKNPQLVNGIREIAERIHG